MSVSGRIPIFWKATRRVSSWFGAVPLARSRFGTWPRRRCLWCYEALPGFLGGEVTQTFSHGETLTDPQLSQKQGKQILPKISNHSLRLGLPRKFQPISHQPGSSFKKTAVFFNREFLTLNLKQLKTQQCQLPKRMIRIPNSYDFPGRKTLVQSLILSQNATLR